ncbi:hypothetical protein BaRGS_00013823, partial [Batillaria attramentaria]
GECVDLPKCRKVNIAMYTTLREFETQGNDPPAGTSRPGDHGNKTKDKRVMSRRRIPRGGCPAGESQDSASQIHGPFFRAMEKVRAELILIRQRQQHLTEGLSNRERASRNKFKYVGASVPERNARPGISSSMWGLRRCKKTMTYRKRSLRSEGRSQVAGA